MIGGLFDISNWFQSIRNVDSILPSLGRTTKQRKSIIENFEKTEFAFLNLMDCSLDKAKLEKNHCHWSRKVIQKHSHRDVLYSGSHFHKATLYYIGNDLPKKIYYQLIYGYVQQGLYQW